MNPERAQMLREIRREYCKKVQGCTKEHQEYCMCTGFESYLDDLFAEAEAQTEPENENEKM